jgi:hypothetical protein
MDYEPVVVDAMVVVDDVDDEQKRFFANGLDDLKTIPIDFLLKILAFIYSFNT